MFSVLLKKEKGMAMPFTLIIMAILALLGSALWYYSSSEALQVTRAQERAQAHYLARSGADALGQFIAVNPENMDMESLIDTLVNAGPSERITLETDFLGLAGTLELEVNEIISDEDDSTVEYLEVRGTGFSGATSHQVALILEKLRPGEIFDSAIKSNNSLTLSKMKEIRGSLVSKGFIQVPDDYDFTQYSIQEYAKFSLPPKKFPARRTTYTAADIDLKSGNTRLIDNSCVIKEVVNKGTLIIQEDTGADLVVEIDKLDSKGTVIINTLPGQIVTLIINEMIELKGDFIIDEDINKGGGNIFLYVRNTANFQTPAFVVDPNSVFIVYLEEGSQMSLDANFIFQGHIYGPQATVAIQSAHCTLHGSAVVNHFDGHNSKVIYRGLAREHEIDMEMGYRISLWRN